MSFRIKSESKPLLADEAHLLSGMDRLVVFVEEHRGAILGGVAMVVMAAVLIGGGVWYVQRQAGEAAELTRQAMKLYGDRPVDNPGKADENLKKAIGLYRQVVEHYPRSPAAPVALYHLGNALVQTNDLAGGIGAYTTFANQYGANKPFLGLVYQRLALAQWLNGDREQAIKTFSAALAVPGLLNKDQILFELGRLEEALSRPEAAVARYQELTKDYPSSPFANEAGVRMKALEAKKPDVGASTGSSPAPASPAESEKK